MALAANRNNEDFMMDKVCDLENQVSLSLCTQQQCI